MFGAAGAGLTGVKVAKRTGNVSDFSFEKVHHHRLSTCLASPPFTHVRR
jgi:hypothetical protein